MTLSNACKVALEKIDYELLLDAVINDYNYGNLTDLKDLGNLLKIPEYKENDDKIGKMLDTFKARGEKIDILEQSTSNTTFKHIAINREFHPVDGENKLRLYLSPKDESLYYIVYELIRRSIIEGREIYFKYSREKRLDKIVIYLKGKKDMDDKINLLNDIKKEYPRLFQDMEKSVAWLSETSFKGAYVAPENFIRDCGNYEFGSYTVLFVSMLKEMRTLLLYELGDLNMTKEQIMSYDEAWLFRVFGRICIKVLGKYGAFLYEEEGKLKTFKNDKFPGLKTPLLEEIFADTKNNLLEVGIRLSPYNYDFRYYQIPASKNIDLNHLEYYHLKYYDMNYDEHYRKKRLF